MSYLIYFILYRFNTFYITYFVLYGEFWKVISALTIFLILEGFCWSLLGCFPELSDPGVIKEKIETKFTWSIPAQPRVGKGEGENVAEVTVLFYMFARAGKCISMI